MTVKVAITGVSGHLGSLIASHILRRSSTAAVHGICRNPDKLPAKLKSNDRFKIFQSGHDNPEKLQEALQGVDIAIFASLGDHKVMLDGQKAVIDACVAAGVKRYMAGDWSLDFRSLKLGELPMKDPMKHVDTYLQEIESKTDGKLKAVHVLNGAFMEIIGMGFYSRKDKKINVWGDGVDAWDVTTYDDSANFSAALALDTSAAGWFSIRGDTVSANDLIREYETAFGSKPEVKQHGTRDELFKTMHGIRQHQPDNMWAWMGLFYTYFSTDERAKLKDLANDKYSDIKWTKLATYLKAAKKPENIGRPYDELAAES